MIKLKNILNEDWSQKYKDSINCDNPKGFSQKAHCDGKEKNESVNESTPAEVIKDLDKVKNDLLKKVEVLIAKKKKLYANVDIESPMSAEEKKLDKDIADVFSQINQLVIQKRNLKKESVNESDLKGYLVADVVDDIIKSIGTRFVSGEIKQSNKNKIYLKLKDVKFGSGVVKILKSRFGIDAKEEMFGGKDKFGSIPSVSFWADKVVSESVNEESYKVAGRPVTLIKGKKSDGTDWKVKFQNGKETALSDVLSLIKPFPKGVHWRYKNLESVNESAKSEKLASLINSVIDKVDSSLSYKDFAMAIGKILKDEYGSHLYSMFVQELNKELKRENESIKLTSLMMPKSNNSIKETFTQSIRNLFGELVPKEVYNAITPQQVEKKKAFIRDLVKTLNNFYRQHGVDWKFADADFKFKMYSKN